MDLYTSKAANALKYAGKVAKKLHHSYIGSEHILLGLLRETDSMAGTILDGYGVYEEKIRELISQLIAPEATQAVMDPDGYTPRARRVLERAAQEAQALSSAQIGTEHLLLAILKEQDSVAARLLNTAGIDAQKMYIGPADGHGAGGAGHQRRSAGRQVFAGCRCGQCVSYPHTGCLQQRYHGTGPEREA